MRHQLEIFENGKASIRNLEVNQTMHSTVGAWEEAETVYIAPSQLAEKLSQTGPSLILWDIGFGLGANALAALTCFMNTPVLRNMTLVSFEADLDGIHTALRHPEHFPQLTLHSKELSSLLETGESTLTHKNGYTLTWQLRLGDFRRQDHTPAPEIIFYDLYSPKVCPELWTPETFQILFAATAPRRIAKQNSVLHTYSAATHIRKALSSAGFLVSQGPGTEAKKETTIAQTFGLR